MTKNPVSSTVRRCTPGSQLVPRIAFDFHGTIADPKKALEALLIEFRGRRGREPGPHELSMMKDQVHTNIPYIAQFVEPVPGSIELLQELALGSSQIFIVTSSNADASNAVLQWLQYRQVDTCISAFFMSGRHRMKREAFIPGMFDLFIENCPRQAGELRRFRIARYVILLTCGDRVARGRLPRGVITAKDFGEVRTHIQRLLPSALSHARQTA